MRKAAVLMVVVLAVFIFVGVMMMQSMLILQRVAAVSDVRGAVQIKTRSAQAFQPLGGRERVAAGDTIVTGDDASVDLHWVDGTRIRLEPRTTMTVRSCQISKANDAETSVFDLSVGKIWVRVLKILSQKSKFEVRTPTATAGVRGTIFSVEVDASGKTSVAVDEGAVAVDTDGTRADVGAKQVVQVGQGTAAAPRSMTGDEEAQWTKVSDIKGPVLEMTAPATDATYDPAAGATVAGTVERDAQVTVNGQPVVRDIKGRFSVQVPAPADKGALEISVIATDARGYSTTLSRTLKPAQ